MPLKPEELTAFQKTSLPAGYVIPSSAAGAAKQQPSKPADKHVHPSINTASIWWYAIVGSSFESRSAWLDAWRSAIHKPCHDQIVSTDRG
jgi:hypothetical protein